MKLYLPLLGLLLVPSVARAQAQAAAPPLAPAPQGKLPEAPELLDHLFDVYEGAKTFRGSFDISAYRRERRGAPPVLAYGVKLQTLVRFNDNGDLNGELSRLECRGGAPVQTQNLRLVDDGQKARLVFEEQKAWQESAHATAPMLRQLIQPIVEEMVRGLRSREDLQPKVSKGKDAGRPVFIVRAKSDDTKVRVLVDVQTRALRLFQLDSALSSLTLRATNQTFDVPVGDTEFAWRPEPQLRQVNPGDIQLPAIVSAMMTPKKPAEAPATAPEPAK